MLENRIDIQTRPLVTQTDGQLTITNEDLVEGSSISPLCVLNFVLPSVQLLTEPSSVAAMEEVDIRTLGHLGIGQADVTRVDLKLTEIADRLGNDWIIVAPHLGISEAQISHIQTLYTYPAEQVSRYKHLGRVEFC